MLDTKNATKTSILIATTAIIQLEVIRIKGHWIAGGNVAFPFLMALLLWYVPKRFREFREMVVAEIATARRGDV